MEGVSELSLFKKMLMIRDCDDPKKLKRHIKYWSTKVENLKNFPLGSEVDQSYVLCLRNWWSIPLLGWNMHKPSWMGGVLYLIPSRSLSMLGLGGETGEVWICLLYTSDAADE